MTILDIEKQPFGLSLSMVFGVPEKLSAYMLDDDQDPVISELRSVNYRYVRFFFHPLRDKFLLCNGWKDPAWTDIRAIRTGIDTEEKGYRNIVFGPNLIDIEQKSIFRLLVDEVSSLLVLLMLGSCKFLTGLGLPSFLRLSGCQSHPVVTGRVLLLRHLHLPYICWKHHHDADGDALGELGSFHGFAVRLLTVGIDHEATSRDFAI